MLVSIVHKSIHHKHNVSILLKYQTSIFHMRGVLAQNSTNIISKTCRIEPKLNGPIGKQNDSNSSWWRTKAKLYWIFSSKTSRTDLKGCIGSNYRITFWMTTSRKNFEYLSTKRSLTGHSSSSSNHESSETPGKRRTYEKKKDFYEN